MVDTGVATTDAGKVLTEPTHPVSASLTASLADKPLLPISACSAGIVSRIVSDRVSSGHSNTGKKELLIQHFDQVNNIKNALAEFLMFHWQDLKNPEFRKRADKEFLAFALPPHPVLTAWEMQKLYRDIVRPRCEDVITATSQRVRLIVRGKAPNVAFGAYKWQSKYRKTESHSQLVRVLRYASQCSPVDFNPATLPVGLRAIWVRITEKFGADRISRLLLTHRKRMFKPPIAPVFTTGSYIKAAQFNKSKTKPTWHSYWKRNDSYPLSLAVGTNTLPATNTRYQDWYCFKSPQFSDRENSALYLPLMVNYGYHHKDYDLRKEHYVSLNAHGEINIGLAYTEDVILPAFNAVIAIDANVKHNQLADSQGRMSTMDQGEWLAKALPVFEKHERKGTANLTHQELRTQQKLNAERDCLLKKMIGESLRYYKAQGITDVIVEQLTFYMAGSGSTILNKILRRFRLSTLKKWFREQAHKLGMRVHDMPSAYSSQACECGHVHASNRKTQEVFLCTECGATANRFAKGACANEVDNPSGINADTHAARNIERLFEYARDVLLLKGLVSINEFGEYCSTQKAYDQYSLLKDIYKNLHHTVFNAVRGDPHLLPSKCAALA